MSEPFPPTQALGVACSVCGDALQPNDRFCGSCGALVNACRSCGTRLVAGDRFCPSCGMTADPAMVTAKISGGGEPAHSAWSGILEKLQQATLGEFQVIRELGRGGMAAVYLAHDIHLDRKVAIKVMSPMLASDQRMVERFRREAKTGAGLKHPNIGTVHRVLEGEGLYFFVMDFIRGRPLDAIIQRNGVLTVDVTRALLYQIGSGLAYAHRRKIYHRDVKPGNVLVSAADGTAVVTDFGIAKVAESTNQTQTGAIVGTPSYMAPEQILGREITGAADQYAFGVMAYEMLTGAPPFVGTSFVVMHAHTEIQPRSIRESRPDCPPELDDAIMRMLAKDPAHRWPSLPHALAAMGATMVGEDDPIREELVRLATPDEIEQERFTTHTPRSPRPRRPARRA
jgi:eukaryotic-like serine/threonine-protein kinase